MSKFEQISNNQRNFQRVVGFPIDSISARDRDEMSEKYLFKAIEEIVELRKEFPSVMNPWSRTQRQIENLDAIKDELADVMLFLVNFINVWGITEDELWDSLLAKQQKNYEHIKTKKLKILNSEMSKVPGSEVQPGAGKLSPNAIIVAENPDLLFEYIQKELNGVENPNDYYTTLIKQHNVAFPSDEVKAFWREFLDRELEILAINNNNVVVQFV